MKTDFWIYGLLLDFLYWPRECPPFGNRSAPANDKFTVIEAMAPDYKNSTQNESVLPHAWFLYWIVCETDDRQNP